MCSLCRSNAKYCGSSASVRHDKEESIAYADGGVPFGDVSLCIYSRVIRMAKATCTLQHPERNMSCSIDDSNSKILLGEFEILFSDTGGKSGTSRRLQSIRQVMTPV